MTPTPQPLDRNELAARLGLQATPGLSQARMLALLMEHGSGLHVYRVLKSACGAEVADAARSQFVRERVRLALERIERDRITVIAHEDAAYPDTLRRALDDRAPPLLFARGQLELLDAPAIAVVGSRQATPYGLDMADRIAAAAAREDICVVSGVAAGIDAAAHSAALDHDGATIGVLGCGVDIYYPRTNRRLQSAIAERGLLLSEFLPGEEPRTYHFPHRNRIIALLSRAVVVVEARAKSGALTTAEHAAKYGVNVYCVMNAMDEPNAAGVVRLLQEGAKLYVGAAHLFVAEGLVRFGGASDADEEPPEPAGVSALALRLWRALGRRAVDVDRLCVQARSAPAEVKAALLELELAGHVMSLPGSRVRRAPYSARRQPT